MIIYKNSVQTLSMASFFMLTIAGSLNIQLTRLAYIFNIHTQIRYFGSFKKHNLGLFWCKNVRLNKSALICRYVLHLLVDIFAFNRLSCWHQLFNYSLIYSHVYHLIGFIWVLCITLVYYRLSFIVCLLTYIWYINKIWCILFIYSFLIDCTQLLH